MKAQITGIKRILNATKYSLQGLKAAFTHEAAIRQECVLLVILSIIALNFEISITHKIILISTLFFIVIIELLNSAIEAVVDRIGSEYHPLSGRAKDIGSAAVFVAILFAILIWLIILI